jgi:hypothetical protein
MRTRLLTIGAVLVATSQSTAQTRMWVSRLGRDTLAVEKYTRSGDRLEGDLVTFSPRTRTAHYVVRFGPDGKATSLEVTARSAVEGPGAPPPIAAKVVFRATDLEAVVERAGKTDTTRIQAANAVPALFLSWGLLESAARAALAGHDSATVLQYSVGAPRANATAIAKRGDSLVVDFFGSPMMVKLDQSGRFAAVNGARTTVKVLATPVADLDLARITESFAARDRSGQSLGQLSARDTVRATIGDATLLVDYGRPSKRGRDIWGGIVPYDAVWRTGANAATQFTTSRDLEVGDLTLPAGTYTLWTLPTAHGTTLIVNRQTKQWGTEYDASKDLGRVAAKTESLSQPIERFTIEIVPAGTGGELRFGWDQLRYSVPFKIKS